MASSGISTHTNLAYPTAQIIINTETTQSSNINNLTTCKIDVSKYPNYYFSIPDDDSDPKRNKYNLIKFSLGFTIVAIIFLIIQVLFYAITKQNLIMRIINEKPSNTAWHVIYFVFLIGILVMLMLAFLGFIFLFENAIDYKPISKIIQIYKNTNVNGCITNIEYGNNTKLQLYAGTKDSIIFIAFIAFLFLFLYSLIVFGYVILLVYSLLSRFRFLN
jgi:hypothetical protein